MWLIEGSQGGGSAIAGCFGRIHGDPKSPSPGVNIYLIIVIFEAPLTFVPKLLKPLQNKQSCVQRDSKFGQLGT